MTVLCPASFAELREMLRYAIYQVGGPVAIRYPRGGEKAYTAAAEPGCSYTQLRDGSDFTILSYGILINEALQAADLLAEKGISAEVIDAFCVKPLDKQTILASVAKTGRCVVAEEHSVYGGLCSAVAEVLAQCNPVPVEFVAVQDRFGKSGEFDELLEYFGLDAASIVDAVEKVARR